jgi:hypothetical protein
MFANTCAGALMLDDDISLPEIWLSLHRSGVAWSQLSGQPDAVSEQHRITASDHKLLQLLHDVPYARWHAFCAACGPTVTATLAGGWSKDAPIAQVAQHWGQLVLDLAQPFAHAARLAPTHLLPRISRLSEAMHWGDSNLALLALCIHAQNDMILDISPAHLANAPPIVGAALRARKLL